MGIFEEVKAGVLCGISGFTKKSGQVIVQRIIREGGEAFCLDSEETKQLTHIIVPKAIPQDSLESKIHNLSYNWVVCDEWAVHSLQQKKRLDENLYKWRNPQLTDSSKRAKEETTDNTRDFPETPTKKSPIKDDSPRFFSVQMSPYKQELWHKNLKKFQFAQETAVDNNEHITKVLEDLQKNYEVLKDTGRSIAYRSAIACLKAHPETITSPKQVKNLARIGSKIKKKIREILETGTLKRLICMNSYERIKVVKLFCEIWGVGAVTAQKLFTMGYRSIEELKANPPEILNQNQRVGLEFFQELSERIPREEVALISEKVKATAQSLAGNRIIQAVTCGSYRRGRETCGDIDILITFEDMQPTLGFLTKLITQLTEEGVVTHQLLVSDEQKKHENSTFEGIARLPDGIHRRLDIKIYPRNFFAWALMHFTGSAQFNRSIRYFAKQAGFRLSDEGIFPAYRTNEETRLGACTAVCYTEEDIFELFGIPYKTPEERDL